MNAAGKIDQPAEHLLCLGLGSNIAPEKNLPEGLRLLAQRLVIEAVSSAWETPAVGSNGPDFLNAAVLVRTRLSIQELKNDLIQSIETTLGRVRTADKNAPRPIDIDILVMDGEVLDPGLWSHVHLAVPVAELLPGYRSPISGETLAEAARRLCQANPVKIRPGILSSDSMGISAGCDQTL